MTTMTEAEAAELGRWRMGKVTMPEWLASDPSPERKRAVLARLLDRVHTPNGLLIKVLARDLGTDPDKLWAERHPRKAAKYAAACRDRGDHPHAGKLHAALISLMFCANCGVPLVDPLSMPKVLALRHPHESVPNIAYRMATMREQVRTLLLAEIPLALPQGAIGNGRSRDCVTSSTPPKPESTGVSARTAGSGSTPPGGRPSSPG